MSDFLSTDKGVWLRSREKQLTPVELVGLLDARDQRIAELEAQEGTWKRRCVDALRGIYEGDGSYHHGCWTDAGLSEDDAQAIKEAIVSVVGDEIQESLGRLDRLREVGDER